MRSKDGGLLRRGALLWLTLVGLLLACQLPQPPRSTLNSPLVSPLTAQSPLSSPGEREPPTILLPSFGASGANGDPVSSTWTLVTLASGAGLLFVATAAGVFFLIRGLPGRRRARHSIALRSAPSTPANLPITEAAAAVGSGRLPEGTLLNEGRYLILGSKAYRTGARVYEVKPTVTLDLCPYCLHRLAEDPGAACAMCGRPLPAQRPEHPVLLAKEVSDAAGFAALRVIARERPDTPVMVPPLALFTETSFGPDRRFVLFPEVEVTLADLWDEPQPLDRVLSWGISLAKGLDVLHDRGVALTGISPAGVQIYGDEARWLCFEGLTELADPQTDHAPKQSTANVSPRTLDNPRVQITANVRPRTLDNPRAQITANVRALAALLTRAAMADKVPLSGEVMGSGAKGLISAASRLSDPAGRVLSQVLRATGYLRAGDLAVALARAREALQRARPVRYTIGAHTDVGRLRKVNEDSFLAMDLSADIAADDLDPGSAFSVVAVADGVGGHAAGDVASQLTVAALTREVEALQADRATGRALDGRAWIAQAATAANVGVLNERQAMASDMGSTLVMAYLAGTHATVLNVGDSRAYWLRSSGIQQVTRDHSLVQRLVDIGQLTPEEARHHPQKSIIYRVMGDGPRLDYDLFDVDLASGHALLLCSDGLTDLVDDSVIWQVWRGPASLQDKCAHLVQLANEGGGHDNITVVIIEVH